MCSLMFKNAQRQGTVVNLRIAEVEREVRHETNSGNIVYVYKVWSDNECKLLLRSIV